MKLTVISILILFLLPLVSSIEFTISSPNKAFLGDNITVSLNLDSSESYDVKVYITNGELENLSRIYNSGWKSTFFYIVSAFPAQKDFLINIVRVEQNTSICTKLRTTNKKSLFESCNKIELATPSQNTEAKNSPSEESSQNNPINNESKDSEEESTQDEDAISDTSAEAEISEEEEVDIEDREGADISTTGNSPNNKVSEKILLNSEKVIGDSSGEDVLLSKEEKLRIGLIYAFSALCVVLIILLSLGKI